ncbi:DNA polymerase IV [Trichloromonas sp.]|uniref:DNA polymerase IV n=1 Tax=Trichloromonas sp. TaxID=3069249 RepID=UPI003D813C89
MNDRVIMHIDMNAFFAAVAQQSNPALRGKPVAVTGSEQRTVILTASYEARARGVKTGLTVGEARARCPELILVPANNRLYTWMSSRIIDIFRDYTPQVEVFSIDEAFLDISGSLIMFGGAERIACLIKARIKARYGLTCSVGIAPNKLLAKLASEMRKPDGLTIIAAADIPRVLEDLPIGELCGIGRKTERQLHLLGVATCGQLGRFPPWILTRKFGIIGEQLQRMGRGIDLSPVRSPAQEAEVKTVGHSMTLREDIRRRETILKFLLQLAEMVGRRARRYEVRGRTVTLTIRYADFTTFSRQQTLATAIHHSDDIYRASIRILDSMELDQPVRLLGVRLSGLQRQARQLPLFGEDGIQQRLAESMDRVNDRYGEFTLMFGSLLDQKEKASHVISPAWRPEGIRNVAVL